MEYRPSLDNMADSYNWAEYWALGQVTEVHRPVLVAEGRRVQDLSPRAVRMINGTSFGWWFFMRVINELFSSTASISTNI